MRLSALAVAVLSLAVGTANAAQVITNSTPASGPVGPDIVAATAAGLPPSAQVMWAVVNTDGRLARGFPLPITSTLQQTGVYRVAFGTRNIAGCAWVGTVGALATIVPAAGHTRTVLAAGTTNTVLVAVTGLNGALVNSPIHLIVTC